MTVVTGMTVTARTGATAEDLHRVADIAVRSWPLAYPTDAESKASQGRRSRTPERTKASRSCAPSGHTIQPLERRRRPVHGVELLRINEGHLAKVTESRRSDFAFCFRYRQSAATLLVLMRTILTARCCARKKGTAETRPGPWVP